MTAVTSLRELSETAERHGCYSNAADDLDAASTKLVRRILVPDNALVELHACATYEAWIAGLESLEPAWPDLPDDYRDRLRDASRAGLRAIAEMEV